MPPPRGTPNPLEGPGDYDMTSIVHSDTYPAIDSAKADLSGKAVFITGASRGLGRAMSISFAKAGASMIAIGARSDLSTTISRMKAAAASVGRPEPTILPLKLDVSDRKSVDEAADEVNREFGYVDIVINNAGILGAGFNLIADSDPDDWWNVLRVNLVGPYLVARAFILLLLKGNLKTIVTVASVGAHLKTRGLSSYQGSKLAVLRLMEHIVAEHGDKGILAYSIHPGNIATDAVVGGVENLPPEFRPVFVDTPELSADSLVYLTSQKRDWLAGRYINVTWDLPELMKMRDEIVEGDKLKVRLVV
ncbi:NAD(P)-binding protein [Hypoxylon sp. FL1857]|nr:NAD(P)-binding protein [Hypoxylon sp. FL1857]